MRFLLSLFLLAPLAAQAAGTVFSQWPSTNVVNSTDLLLLDSNLGGGNYATRTITVSKLPAPTFAQVTNALSLTGDTSKFMNGAGLLSTPSSGGFSGAVKNTGTPTVGQIPAYSDTTGTNVAPATSIKIGVSTPTNAFVNFGTNAPGGYLMSSGSQSGISTNLGFNWAVQSTTFDTNAAPDETLWWGYNIGPGGTRANTHDSATGFGIEGNYNFQPGNGRYTEVHLGYIDTNDVGSRLWSWTIDKNNTNNWSHYNSIISDAWYWPKTQIPWMQFNNTGVTITPSATNTGHYIFMGYGGGGYELSETGAATSPVLQLTSFTGGINLPNSGIIGGPTWQISSVVNVIADKALQFFDGSSNYKLVFFQDRMWQRAASTITWTATSNAADSADTGLARSSAGVVRVSNGSSGGGKLSFLSTTNTPTGANIGAGGGIFWVSNAVAYVSVSSDGSSVTTKQIAP